MRNQSQAQLLFFRLRLQSTEAQEARRRLVIIAASIVGVVGITVMPAAEALAAPAWRERSAGFMQIDATE